MCLLCNFLKSINSFTNKCYSTYGFWLTLSYLQTYLIKLKYFSYIIYYLDLWLRERERERENREREGGAIAIDTVYQQLYSCNRHYYFYFHRESDITSCDISDNVWRNFTSDFITFVPLELYYTSVSQTMPYVHLQHSFRW